MRQQSAGNDNGIVAKTDNVAEAKKCRESVYLQDHPGFFSQAVHKRNESESYDFIPQPDADGQKFIDAGDYYSQY